MQSPKSRRNNSGPDGNPASDNNPVVNSGNNAPQHTGKNTTKVPVRTTTGPKNPMPTEHSERLATTATYHPPAGRAGYQDPKSGDASKSGGSPHRFPNGSE